MTTVACNRAETCGQCKNGKAWTTDNDHQTGFVNCKHGPAWEYLPETASCQFKPSRFEPQKQEGV